MKSRTVIIILSSIILIQLIAGVFILTKRDRFYRSFAPSMFMNDKTGFSGMHYGRGNRFGRHFCEPEFMRDRLALEQEQIDKINELNSKFEDEFLRHTRLAEPEKKKLRDMLKSNSIDMDLVRKQLEKMKTIDIDMQMLQIKQGKEISEILSAEQMRKLRLERKNFFETMRGNTARKNG